MSRATPHNPSFRKLCLTPTTLAPTSFHASPGCKTSPCSVSNGDFSSGKLVKLSVSFRCTRCHMKTYKSTSYSSPSQPTSLYFIISISSHFVFVVCFIHLFLLYPCFLTLSLSLMGRFDFPFSFILEFNWLSTLFNAYKPTLHLRKIIYYVDPQFFIC